MPNSFQLIISFVNKIEYHAAVYIPNIGIADLSLLGARITRISKYNKNEMNFLFYNLDITFSNKFILYLKQPCLISKKIIDNERKNRGWFKLNESADFILKFRKYRSKNVNDMNCIEWIVHGLEIGGIKMPNNILTASKLNLWAKKKLIKIKKEDNNTALKNFY